MSNWFILLAVLIWAAVIIRFLAGSKGESPVKVQPEIVKTPSLNIYKIARERYPLPTNTDILHVMYCSSDLRHHLLSALWIKVHVLKHSYHHDERIRTLIKKQSGFGHDFERFQMYQEKINDMIINDLLDRLSEIESKT